MCEICLQSPCPPRCPNARERPVCRCCRCAEPIYPGEEWAERGEEAVCWDCLTDMSTREMASFFGAIRRG